MHSPLSHHPLINENRQGGDQLGEKGRAWQTYQQQGQGPPLSYLRTARVVTRATTRSTLPFGQYEVDR